MGTSSRFFNASLRKSLKVLKSGPRPVTASHTLSSHGHPFLRKYFKHSAPVLVGVLQTLQVAAQIADLETAVASRDQQIDELRSALSDIVSRLDALDA